MVPGGGFGGALAGVSGLRRAVDVDGVADLGTAERGADPLQRAGHFVAAQPEAPRVGPPGPTGPGTVTTGQRA